MCVYIYIFVCVCICIYIHVYMCICVYIVIHIYVYMYICIYVHIWIYIHKCINMHICARVCICICMYMYVYTYGICIYVCKYVHVCMWTLLDVIEGPYHPLRCGLRGCCFWEHRIRFGVLTPSESENTESDWYTASPYGLVDLQLPHSSDRGYYIPLSVSVTVVYPPLVVLSCTPSLRTYCWSSINNKDANLTSLPSVLH